MEGRTVDGGACLGGEFEVGKGENKNCCCLRIATRKLFSAGSLIALTDTLGGVQTVRGTECANSMISKV